MSDLRQMKDFDPDKPALVHDGLNDKTFEWKPDWADRYRELAREHEPGVVEWDGLLLDGWQVMTKAL